MFVPKDSERSLTRLDWKWLDHTARLMWRLQGSQIQEAMTDLIIYGSCEIAL